MSQKIYTDLEVNGMTYLNVSAITGRETLLTGKISDNALDKFQIGNSTTVSGRFGPTFIGYTAGAYTGLAFRGLGDVSADLITTTPYVAFLAANTNNSSDPNNGTLSAPTNRDLFSWGTVGGDYMRMKASGRLLLNTTVDNGVDRLQISGYTLATGYKIPSGLSTWFLKADGSYDSTTYQTAITNPITGTGTINYVSKFIGTSSLGDSIIYDDGTNVGIGTIIPSQKLEVNGNALVKTTFIGTISAFGDNYGSFSHISRAGNNDYSLLSENNGTTYLNASASQSIKFRINNIDKAILNSNGDFGIGTTLPSQKLHVAGSTRVEGAIYDSTNSPGTSGQVLTSTVTGNSWSTLSSIGGLPAGGTAGQILTKVDGTNYNATWQENYADWTSIVKYIVKNNGSALITKGTPVYSTGSDGTNILVGKAGNQSEATSSKTLGLMQSDITTTGTTQTGFVISEGLLAGLNTAGQIAGDPVWLGPTGTLIYGLANKPYAPAHLVFIGIVTKVSAGTGEIFVKVQNGFELEELHNVDLKTTIPINGHILGFDGTLWVNKTIAGWLGYTPANANGTTNQVAKFTGTTTLGNSSIFDNVTNVGINTISGFLGYTQITSVNSTVSPGGGGGAFTATSQLMLASNSTYAINAGGVINFGGKYNTVQNYVGFGRIGGRKENAISGNIAGYLNFEVAENSNGGFLERMRISSLGNVGISTISPTEKLHVIGRMSLDNGQESTYIGPNSGIADLATTSTRNVGVGSRTFQNNITGAKNVAIGVNALQLSLGDDNVGIGFEALKANTVSSNSALGYQALTASTTAIENVAIGKFALREILTGSYNTALGYAAGRFVSAGTSNTLTSYSLFLGHSTRPLNSSDTNTIVIGASSVGIGSNTVVLGNDSITTTALKGNVGIGTTNPQANLEIFGVSVNPTLRIACVPTSGYGGGGNIDFVGGSSDYVSGAISWKNGVTTRGKINYDGVFDAMTISSESETIFINNGSERARITGIGNIGIGTTSPQSKLHIIGSGITLSTADVTYGFGSIKTLVPDAITYPYEGDMVFSSFRFNGSYNVVENLRIVARTGNIKAFGSVQVGDDIIPPSATNVGAIRYRSDPNNSYMDMVMQTGASTYAWVNIVQNNW